MGIVDKFFGDSHSTSDATTGTGTSYAKYPWDKINVGDMIEIEGVDYQVTARIVYYESGWIWYDYRLVRPGDKKKYWFSAAFEDGEWELALYEEQKPATKLLPEKFEAEGKKFSLVEHGIAEATIYGPEGAQGRQMVEYWEWEDEKGEYLIVMEDWKEGVYEVAEGRPLLQEEVEVYPAS